MTRKGKDNSSEEESSPKANDPYEETDQPSEQSMDDVGDLLAEMDADVVIDEPDGLLLTREVEEISTLPEDEPLELLRPTFDADLGEDPH